MHKRDNAITYSASDLVGLLGCPHRSTLDLIDLDTPLARAAPDEQIELVQDKDFAHEANYLDALRTEGGRLIELSSTGSFAENLAATRIAMAEAAITSMATSNGDTLPRFIEFLYSKNRLNVAILRASCLALLVASPALADVPCATVEQMGLVNLLCSAINQAAAFSGE